MTADQEARRVFVVIIGDIVGSRQLPDRAVAQDRLREAVAAFNAKSEYDLAASLEVTGGDEIKTILDDPVVCVDLITGLSEALHPMEMAWGVGRGPITTSWVPDVGNLDGPCFHRARQASEEASKDGIWARAYGFSPLDDRILGTLFRLTGAIRSVWTEKQMAYIRSARVQSQKATAAEFDVTEGAVSQSLQRARFADVEEAEATLRELLARYRPGAERPDRFEDEA